MHIRCSYFFAYALTSTRLTLALVTNDTNKQRQSFAIKSSEFLVPRFRIPYERTFCSLTQNMLSHQIRCTYMNMLSNNTKKL